MQKLVTVHLDSSVYGQEKWFKGTTLGQHGIIEEHLEKYLSDGWRITAVPGIGGHDNHLSVRGWIIAVLEKQ